MMPVLRVPRFAPHPHHRRGALRGREPPHKRRPKAGAPKKKELNAVAGAKAESRRNRKERDPAALQLPDQEGLPLRAEASALCSKNDPPRHGTIQSILDGGR